MAIRMACSTAVLLGLASPTWAGECRFALVLAPDMSLPNSSVEDGVDEPDGDTAGYLVVRPAGILQRNVGLHAGGGRRREHNVELCHGPELGSADGGEVLGKRAGLTRGPHTDVATVLSVLRFSFGMIVP